MSDTKRKHLSGALKRKMKVQKEEKLSRLQKLTNVWETKTKSQSQQNSAQKSTESIDEENSKDSSKIDITLSTDETYVNNETSIKSNNACDLVQETFISTTDLQCNHSTAEMTTINLQNIDFIDMEDYADPGKWPVHISESFRDLCLNKGPEFFQNRCIDKFYISEREYKTQKRYLSNTLFDRKLPNGEVQGRKWLMFSENTGSVYCYVCKLFSCNSESAFVRNGFNNWKRAEEKTSEHENSATHRKHMMTWLSRMHVDLTLKKKIAEQLESEKVYWTKVLERIVAVIKFLSQRGLAFEGENSSLGSPNNGNFLGILELLAQFDPFLKDHLETYGNKGKGNVSYISKTVYNELIEVMGKEVLHKIINEVKCTKYFALILDSTPDASHFDQLSFVIRYCSEGHVYERFLTFIQIQSHVGKVLCDYVVKYLSEQGLDLKLCRGQSYDNANNMAGEYEGLQAHIKKISDVALFAPCSAHSLNLCGVHAAECCLEAVNFFGIIQKVYSFFVASTHRWAILCKNFKDSESNRLHVLKSLSDTRWSRHTEACKAVKVNYQQIINSFEEIASNENEPSECRIEAKSLKNKLLKFQTGFMTILWNKILARFNDVSTYLQEPGLDLLTAVNLLKSLDIYVSSLREKFEDMKQEMKSLSDEIMEFNTEKRIKKRKFPDGKDDFNVTGKKKFKIETLHVIIDNLNTELKKRIAAYDTISSIFSFISKLGKEVLEENSVQILIEKYSSDIEDSIKSEIVHFSHFIKECQDLEEKNPINIYKYMHDQRLFDIFPNVFIAIRIYLTLPVSNCEAER